MIELNTPAKKGLTRTLSDTGKLKTDVLVFLDEWNTNNNSECNLNSSGKSCHVKRQAWMEAFDLLLRPVLSLCRRNDKQSSKWRSESNIHCRQQSQFVDSEQQTCPLSQKRAMSESNLNCIKHVKCLAEFSPERQKRVCFSAPMSSACGRTFEKRCCPSKPRPILSHRNCIVAKPDYMDYSTFKAWRRGSRLSIDVCSIPLKAKDCKEKKIERILKNFISNCVNQMNNRAIPDM